MRPPITLRYHHRSSSCPLGSFYRAAVPADVLAGNPTPSTWGEPVAMLDPSGCDPIANFVNHSIVFGAHASAALSSPCGRLISGFSSQTSPSAVRLENKLRRLRPTLLISFLVYLCHR